MSIRQATVIPFCEECKTSFAVKCRHVVDKVVFLMDEPETPTP